MKSTLFKRVALILCTCIVQINTFICAADLNLAPKSGYVVKKSEAGAKMSFWGVGPKVMGPGYVSAFLLYWFTAKDNILTVLKTHNLPGYIMSISLIAAGTVLFLITQNKIKKALKTHTLVTTGVFGYIRNPMYAAHLFFIMPGLFLLFSNAWIWLSLVISLVLFNLLISREEAVLQKLYGDEYDGYKIRVSRLLPRPLLFINHSS
jgi:protein-S-isoprenylcysteine O-methyltransferase Ste14